VFLSHDASQLSLLQNRYILSRQAGYSQILRSVQAPKRASATRIGRLRDTLWSVPGQQAFPQMPSYPSSWL